MTVGRFLDREPGVVVRQPRPGVSNVRPLFRNDPELVPPCVFDQDAAPIGRGGDGVVLSSLEAQLIASLLDRARSVLPSQRAVDDAIELLTGTRPSGGAA